MRLFQPRKPSPALAPLALALMVAGAILPAGAAEEPVHPDVWQIKLGQPLKALVALNMFADFACGTNGGPPSTPLAADASDFAKCRPEASGLREIYFRYDDELEYWARANNLDIVVEQNGGTRVYEFPTILSALVDDQGVVRGLRMFSDPRDRSASRADAYQLGTFLMTRFGRDTWTCTDLPPATGESAVNGTFVKQHCEKTADGYAYVIDIRYLRKPGQAQFDPVNGQPTVGQFQSDIRFEMHATG